jgi:hypothetical protein
MNDEIYATIALSEDGSKPLTPPSGSAVAFALNLRTAQALKVMVDRVIESLERAEREAS